MSLKTARIPSKRFGAAIVETITVNHFEPSLVTHEYMTGVSKKLFSKSVTRESNYGYLRLSLPQQEAIIDELKNAAIVRELHIYGKSLPLKGPSLLAANIVVTVPSLQEAAKIACQAGYNIL